jgi:hypothetical protein
MTVQRPKASSLYKQSSLFFQQPQHPQQVFFGASLSSQLVEDATEPSSHVRYRITDYAQEGQRIQFKSALQRFSSAASLLCLLDCTLLPLVTLILPLVGMAAPHLEILHQIGHTIALGVVVPLGIVTMVLNQMSHRKVSLAVLSLLGIALVIMTNSNWILPMHHLLHHGWTHRLINIGGCVLLLSSNYLSHQHQNCDC